jgi:hypothetical protein
VEVFCCVYLDAGGKAFVETWTLRAIGQKHLESFEMCVLEKDGDQLDQSCEK